MNENISSFANPEDTLPHIEGMKQALLNPDFNEGVSFEGTWWKELGRLLGVQDADQQEMVGNVLLAAAEYLDLPVSERSKLRWLAHTFLGNAN